MRKLATYNYTIFDMSNSDVTCFMWHEAEGSKGSSESATCLEMWMKKYPNAKHFIFYSDTAAGQNRNQAVLALFLHTVASSDIDIIDQKFMESGHSQMECDSVHSMV